jgi:hypothetical protein
MEVAPLAIDVEGDLPVLLSSADGEPHEVAVVASTARGLRSSGSGETVAVPATGVAAVSLRLVRAGAPRGTRHGVLVVADVVDGSLARTAVVASAVDVAPDPSVLPRVRGPVFGVALLLLSAAALVEWRRRGSSTTRS